MHWRPILIMGLTVLAIAAARADGLPDLGEAAQVDLSPQMERRIGEGIMRDIRLREPAFVDDAEVSGYLNRLGRRLAAKSDEVRQDFEFFAIDDASINAFAMPGGYIGVHTGLILAAQSESELASVLAHEISHVTQRHLARLVGQRSQSQLASLLSLAVAILAARSNPDAAMGAAIAGQAAGIQQQLNYSRDFEREADRLGLRLLEGAGYDIRGMGSFFEKLQQYGRLYENGSPGYLRTHPLTTERIADVENRIHQRPYRQVADSMEFMLVKAKLKARTGPAPEAVAEFEQQLRDRKFSSEAAVRYGLAQAQYRLGNVTAAEAQIAELRRLKVASPMLETLAAQLRSRSRDSAGAVRILRAAAGKYPEDRAVAYALVDTLIADQRADEALKLAKADLQGHTTDFHMAGLQAKALAQLGKRLQQHRAQAEAYALQGQYLAAIEQLMLAQKSPDGDFFEYSQVDARLREIKALQAQEAKEARERKR